MAVSVPVSRETLPAELYRSNEVYERGIDTVFRRSWACAASGLSMPPRN